MNEINSRYSPRATLIVQTILRWRRPRRPRPTPKWNSASSPALPSRSTKTGRPGKRSARRSLSRTPCQPGRCGGSSRVPAAIRSGPPTETLSTAMLRPASAVRRRVCATRDASAGKVSSKGRGFGRRFVALQNFGPPRAFDDGGLSPAHVQPYDCFTDLTAHHPTKTGSPPAASIAPLVRHTEPRAARTRAPPRALPASPPPRPSPWPCR